MSFDPTDRPVQRSDVQAIRSELTGELSALRAELRSEIIGLGADVKLQLASLQTRLLLANVAAALTAGGLILAALKLA